MIDTRREAAHVEKEFGRYQAKIGESVVWFVFDAYNSQYSGTYDEGGRKYLPGVLVPILWVDQIEAPEQYVPEGRRPVQGCASLSRPRRSTSALCRVSHLGTRRGTRG